MVESLTAQELARLADKQVLAFKLPAYYEYLILAQPPSLIIIQKLTEM